MSVLALLCGDCKAILDTEECETHEVSRVSEFWGQRQVGHFVVGPLCPCCQGDDLKTVQLCHCGQLSAEGCAECDTCCALTVAQETLELAGPTPMAAATRTATVGHARWRGPGQRSGWMKPREVRREQQTETEIAESQGARGAA